MVSVVSPILVGRAGETGVLREVYERARAGRPATVLVSGEAGIGKSRLVKTAIAELPGDPLVLVGSCLELGSDAAPYVPFVAIIRSMLRQVGLDRVVELLPPGGSVLGAWLAELGPAPANYVRTRLMDEVLTLIARAAQAKPVVLIIEDLHWADASSRELFAYLAKNLADCPVVLIGTVRTGALAAAHPSRQLLAELGRDAGVLQISLKSLGHKEVAELLTAIDGSVPEAARSRRIHRRSGGNPLFVEALSDAAEETEGDLKALLLNRISVLSSQAREVLAAMAVAGAGVNDEVLRDVSALPDNDFTAAVRELAEHDLVVIHADEYSIRHDLIREAVYGSLLPSDRRRWHARCARALADRDATDSALAGHWSAAGEFELALPAAWEAADRAGRQHAYDEQLYLLEIVLGHWTPGVLGVGLQAVREKAAAAAFAAGKSARAIELSTTALNELDFAAEPERAARLLGLRGQAESPAGGAGWEDLQRAVSLVPPGRSDALRSRLLSALAFVCVGGHRHEESRAAAAEAMAIADRLGDDALRAPALVVLALIEGNEGKADSANEKYERCRRLAQAVGDEHTFLASYQWQALLIAAIGRYRDAADLAAAGRQAAQRLGRGRSRGTMLAVGHAMFLQLLGRWDEALGVLDDALADAPPPMYAAHVRVVTAGIMRRRGQADRFEALMQELTKFGQDTPAASDVNADILVEQALWALDGGDLDLADRLVAEATSEVFRHWHPPDLMQMVMLAARVQRARRAASPRNARVAKETETRLAELTRLIDPLPAPWPGIVAYRLTFTALTVGNQLSLWDKAIQAWRELGNPYETATALTDAAAVALASNNRPGALSRLREAGEIAEMLGAQPLLTRIEDLMTRGRLTAESNAVVRNDFGLTSRELDVLRVLARGRSNQEIAAELFISTNTVATHVARIRAKLGASTRTEAAAKANEANLV